MTLFRLLGTTLGVLFVVFGACVLLFFTELGIRQRATVGIASVGMGVYFLNYGITGRRYLFGRPPV